MKTYDSFQLFWNDYGAARPNTYGFDDWTIVRFSHTSDATYKDQQQKGTNELGFQPLWLTLANPFSKQSKNIIIKNVDDRQAAAFSNHSAEKFYKQMPGRFGSFRPSETHAYAEYDTWESFYNVWLERGGTSMLHLHVPLLFDHTAQLEHWTRKQTLQTVLPYQRLLLTTFFAPKELFFDFFIKNVTDGEMERIKQLSLSRIGLRLDSLYTATRG